MNCNLTTVILCDSFFERQRGFSKNGRVQSLKKICFEVKVWMFPPLELLLDKYNHLYYKNNLWIQSQLLEIYLQ